MKKFIFATLVFGLFAYVASVLATATPAFAFFNDNDPEVSITESVTCGTGSRQISGTANYHGDSTTRLRVTFNPPGGNNTTTEVNSTDEPATWSFTKTLTVGQQYTIEARVYDDADADSNDLTDTDTWTFTHAACPTPTQAPPETVKILVCHQDGQSGNYSDIEVSVHSTNDANGLNGHGDHEGDSWASFVFDGTTYPGQGDQSLVRNNCEPVVVPTATPTPTPTPTPTQEVTPTPTPTPIQECEGECPEEVTPTPDPTATPTATPTPGNPGGPGDGKSDGKSDGRSSCPECTQAPAIGGGDVLGASTDWAGTGAAENMIVHAAGVLGGLSTAVGIYLAKKRSN